MELNREPLKNWFGYTRRERRSSFVLLLIVLLIVAFRYIVPEQNDDFEQISWSNLQTGGNEKAKEEDKPIPSQKFSFDPNSATYDTLIQLGFAEKEARTLISYRNKGGRFRQPSDIRKVFGIEEKIAESLIPFVEIRKDTLERYQANNIYQQKALIEINSCDSASLVRLPGIGPVLSARIIKYRHLLGGFARVDQLKEVYGLKEETYELIKAKLFADTTILNRVKINSAGYKDLVRLPYFEKYEVTSILKYKELKGNITGIRDLIDNKIITVEKAAKVRPYIDFE
jgi:competence protein ComEA